MREIFVNLSCLFSPGYIPKWVSGCFLRNGPGRREINGHEYQHLFDGLALMQKLVIKSGNVTYTSRFLRSDSYTKNTKYNRIVVSEFGTVSSFPDPCKNIFSRLRSYFTLDDIFTDNDLVSFYFIGDQLYACTDGPYIRRIDVSTLDTLERVDLNKVVAVNTATSHPHTDSQGNTYNIGSNFGSYNVTCFPKEGLESGFILAKIAVSHPLDPSYYHSFLITSRYIIFIEQPLLISIPKVLYQHRIIRGVSSEIFKWKPHLGTRFYIIDREKKVQIDQVYTADAFSFFHTINAYEENEHLVCDIVTYKDPSYLNTLYINSIKEAEKNSSVRSSHEKFLTSRADRFVLPLLTPEKKKTLTFGKNVNKIGNSSAISYLKSDGSIHCLPEHLTEEGEANAEMPTINYKYYNGKTYKYFYGFTRCKKTNSLGLMKVNCETKKYISWFDDAFYPSEALFVPKPNGSLLPEDEGVLLSLVINLQIETNGFLLILNAKNFTELARATFDACDVIPPGFHGIFLPHEEKNEEKEEEKVTQVQKK